MGSVISSTILNLADLVIDIGKGSSVFSTNSCIKESLFNKRLMAGTNIPLPKFNINSLK